MAKKNKQPNNQRDHTRTRWVKKAGMFVTTEVKDGKFTQDWFSRGS